MAKPANASTENSPVLTQEPEYFRGQIVARLILVTLLTAYFFWLPTAPLLLTKQTIYWIAATFGSFQLASWWMYRRAPSSELRIRIESWIDILFVSGALLIDSNELPLSLFMLLGLLLANAVQHGQKMYFELLSVATILIILSSLIRQQLIDQPMYYPFIGSLVFIATCLFFVSLIIRANEHYKVLAARIGEIDSLTGMLNQQAFIRAANYLITLSQRTPMPMVLFIAEIENYHHLNEKMGQPTGDLILKHLSRITLINLRRNDLSARITGNTFAFLITNVDKKSAELVAVRLQYEFALWADKEKLEASISFAMTTLPNYNITIQIMLKHLGQYLHTSKKTIGTPGVAQAPPLSAEDIIKLQATL